LRKRCLTFCFALGNRTNSGSQRLRGLSGGRSPGKQFAKHPATAGAPRRDPTTTIPTPFLRGGYTIYCVETAIRCTGFMNTCNL